jgi:hypothetical protein
MAIESRFYINAADFTTATAVYLDSTLTYIAPDGYYKIGSVVRQQSGGILLTAETCAACATPCGTEINSNSATGVYQINVDTGTGTGAIKVKFDVGSIPDGIRITYDGVIYNKISSPVYGAVQSSNSGHYTIIGTADSVSTCSSWYPAGGTLTNDVYLYDYLTSSFNATGSTQINTIATSDFFVYSPNDFGESWMIIPKPTTTPSTMLIEIIGPCSDTVWYTKPYCAAALPSFSGSLKLTVPTSAVPCSTQINQTYYWSKVNTTTSTRPQTTDYVFLDENGEFPLPDGDYLIVKDLSNSIIIIRVVNGIVTVVISSTCI